MFVFKGQIVLIIIFLPVANPNANQCGLDRNEESNTKRSSSPSGTEVYEIDNTSTLGL